MRFFLIYILLNFYLLSFSFSHFATGENIVIPVGERSAVPVEDSIVEATLKVDLRTKNFQNSLWYMHNFVYSGTTFSIGPNLFVTNFHVLNEILKNEISIKDIIFQQKDDYSHLKIKRIVAVSALYDLVLFETEQSVRSYLNIADNLSQSNEKLLILGYPQMEFKEIKQTGKVVDSKYLYIFLHVDHSKLEGTSGSPVLNTEGQVVGVASTGTINMLSVIKLDHLKGLIAGDVGLNCFDLDTVMCIEAEMKNLRNSAEQGYFPAQYILATNYYIGLGSTKQDFKLAFDWMKKPAEQGYAPAQYLLGLKYYYGVGTERDFELAFDWMKKPAEQGYSPARYSLARMYYNGIGTKQDFKSAFNWMKKSAEQNYSPAQYDLAVMYYYAKGTKRDIDSMLYWMKKSAEQNHPPAQYDLAMMYYNGEGTARNLELAFDWMKKSAEQNHPPAQHNLASMYYNGEGTERDFELAFDWMKKSAKQGYAPAQQFLENFFYSYQSGHYNNLCYV